MNAVDHRAWMGRRASALVLTVLFALGCRSEAAGPESSSETHFLRLCEQSCGAGLSCICGVCTEPCTAEASCQALSARARCESLPSTCGSEASAQVCDVGCKADGECAELGAKHVCVAGSCRLQVAGLTARTPFPGSTTAASMDAGAPGDAQVGSDAQDLDSRADGPRNDASEGGASDGSTEPRDPSIPLLVGGAWRPGYRCSVARPFAAFADASHPGSLLSGPRGSYLTRMGGTTQSQLELVRVMLDGTLGAPARITELIAANVGGSGGDIGADRSTLSWQQISNLDPKNRLWVAQLDTAGAVVSAAHRVTIASEEETSGHLIPLSQGGYALGYLADFRKLKLARLDANARLVGEPIMLSEGPGGQGSSLSDLVATPRGFMMFFSAQSSELGTDLFVQAFDAQGQPLAEPTLLDTGSFGGDLLTRGDEVIAAWWSGVRTPRSSVIRLARIASDGTKISATYNLQYPVGEETNSSPVLLAMGRDVVLLWAQGNFAANCVGTCPNPSITRFVVLDGADLSMKGDVLALGNEVGGVSFPPQGSVQNLDVLVHSGAFVQSASVGMTATIRCLPDPTP